MSDQPVNPVYDERFDRLDDDTDTAVDALQRVRRLAPDQHQPHPESLHRPRRQG